VIEFDKVQCMDLIGIFLGIVTFKVSFPFDEVLECSSAFMTLVASYQLHFVFHFSIDQVRWWPGEVRAM